VRWIWPTPPEAEEFRVEIREWLSANLPSGWGDDDFEMTPDERKQFNEQWPKKLFAGGWICATWPKEYGGKGLTTMQGVVLAKSSPGRRRRCEPISSATRWSARPSPMGHRGAEEGVPAAHPQRLGALVPGFQRTELRFRSCVAQDHRGARR
jgi:hypothetical protein